MSRAFELIEQVAEATNLTGDVPLSVTEAVVNLNPSTDAMNTAGNALGLLLETMKQLKATIRIGSGSIPLRTQRDLSSAIKSVDVAFKLVDSALSDMEKLNL